MNRLFICLGWCLCLMLCACSSGQPGSPASPTPKTAAAAQEEAQANAVAEEKRAAAIALERQRVEEAAAAPATPATVSTSDDTIDIGGKGASNTMPGNGRDIFVTGSAHRLTFSGEVGLLQAEGSDQEISLENAKSVVISGDNIRVSYSGPKPEVSVSGSGSSCDPR